MRALRAGLLLGILLVAVLACVPQARAAQRTTLILSNVTLHEALLRIRSQLGWDLRGPSGEGTDFYEQADNASRASFTWKNATLGKVCRDLGEAFHCVPGYGPQGIIQFEAQPNGGGKPLSSTTRESIGFSVVGLSAVRSVEPAAAKPRIRESCQGKLALHPFDSDLDTLY